VRALDATHWQPPGGAWPEDFADPAFQAHLAASGAAHERCKAYTRLYTRRGSVAHLSPPWGHRDDVLCGFGPQGEWRGTGSQAEYELAAEMETCSRCGKAFMDSQRCGNPECPCQKWGHLAAGGDR
jgi:hypothetical protein